MGMIETLQQNKADAAELAQYRAADKAAGEKAMVDEAFNAGRQNMFDQVVAYQPHSPVQVNPTLQGFGNDNFKYVEPGLSAHLATGPQSGLAVNGSVVGTQIGDMPMELSAVDLGLAGRYGNWNGEVGVRGNPQQNYENPEVRASVGYDF